MEVITQEQLSELARQKRNAYYRERRKRLGPKTTTAAVYSYWERQVLKDIKEGKISLKSE